MKSLPISEARYRGLADFWNAWFLNIRGYVTKRFLKGIRQQDGSDIYLDIVERLECVLDPNYVKEPFKAYRGIPRTITAEEKILGPLPVS